MSSLMDYLLLAIGVYVLINGIRGKGKLFQMEFLKEGYEEKFKKTLRALYIPMGVIMILNGVVSILKGYFYEQVAVPAATEGANGTFEWVLKEGKDLGSLSFLTPTFFTVCTYVCMGLVIVSVVILIITMRSMTDKEAQKKAAAAGAQGGASRDPRQAGHVLPVSAFDFEEPKEQKDAPQD